MTLLNEIKMGKWPKYFKIHESTKILVNISLFRSHLDIIFLSALTKNTSNSAYKANENYK